MNKRIKFKKGIFHKDCDDRCPMHREIKKHRFITCNGCGGCRHRDIAEKLCQDNERLFELTKDIKVYQMNDYEWWASRWDKKATNEWYKKEHDLWEEDNPIEAVKECDLDKTYTWEELNIKYKSQAKESKGKAKVGDIRMIGNTPWRLITFREAIEKDLTFKEPYCIGAIDW